MLPRSIFLCFVCLSACISPPDSGADTGESLPLAWTEKGTPLHAALSEKVTLMGCEYGNGPMLGSYDAVRALFADVPDANMAGIEQNTELKIEVGIFGLWADIPEMGIAKEEAPQSRVFLRPQMHLELKKASPSCSKENIDHLITRKANRLRNCYERRLLTDSNLKGTLQLAWVVANARVENFRVLSSTLGDPLVDRCMMRVIEAIPFAATSDPCEVEYSFAFSAHRP